MEAEFLFIAEHEGMNFICTNIGVSWVVLMMFEGWILGNVFSRLCKLCSSKVKVVCFLRIWSVCLVCVS